MIINLILLIVLISIALRSYLVRRNNRVYHFSISLSDLLLNELKRILNTYKDDDEFCKDKINYDYIKEKIQILLNKHSYNRYLFSFKPLKLKNWFTEEELEFIKYLRQYRK